MGKQTKEYRNAWYAKNKDRLKAKPGFKEYKKEADRKYYEKNRDKLLAYAKEYNQKNGERIKKTRRQYYLQHMEQIINQRKAIRATPEYKAYMKEYRAKNYEKIREQENVCGKRYAAKIAAQITEGYVLGLLTNTKVGCFDTFEEARKYPELIKFYQSQIKIKRLCQQLSKTSQN